MPQHLRSNGKGQHGSGNDSGSNNDAINIDMSRDAGFYIHNLLEITDYF
jgi:hypothetical protein